MGVGKILKSFKEVSSFYRIYLSPPDIYSNDYTLDLKSFDKFSVAIYIKRDMCIVHNDSFVVPPRIINLSHNLLTSRELSLHFWAYF